MKVTESRYIDSWIFRFSYIENFKVSKITINRIEKLTNKKSFNTESKKDSFYQFTFCLWFLVIFTINMVDSINLLTL